MTFYEKRDVPPGVFLCNRCKDHHPLTVESLLKMNADPVSIYMFVEGQNRPSKCGDKCKKPDGPLGCLECCKFNSVNAGLCGTPYLTFSREDIEYGIQKSLLVTTKTESRLMKLARELYAAGAIPKRDEEYQVWLEAQKWYTDAIKYLSKTELT